MLRPKRLTSVTENIRIAMIPNTVQPARFQTFFSTPLSTVILLEWNQVTSVSSVQILECPFELQMPCHLTTHITVVLAQWSMHPSEQRMDRDHTSMPTFALSMHPHWRIEVPLSCNAIAWYEAHTVHATQENLGEMCEPTTGDLALAIHYSAAENSNTRGLIYTLIFLGPSTAKVSKFENCKTFWNKRRRKKPTPELTIILVWESVNVRDTAQKTKKSVAILHPYWNFAKTEIFNTHLPTSPF